MMQNYKSVLCYQTQPVDQDQDQLLFCQQSPSNSRSFTSSCDFHDWLYYQMRDYRVSIITRDPPKPLYYSRKQVEILDLIEADVIDFLFEIREEFNLRYNLADFLDDIVFPNMSTLKEEDLNDDDDTTTGCVFEE